MRSMEGQNSNSSLQLTPTWVISIICLCLILISFFLDALLHFLTQFLTKRKRKSLVRALEKTETEMMTMGFISLLLTISEVPISKICATQDVANSFHPCKHPIGTPVSSLSTDTTGLSYCQAKGMVSLISREGVMQLKMFIFVLAVFHVFYCILTMFLGMAKMRRWKAWEKETQSFEYQIANDPMRFRLTQQTTFGRRQLKMWREHPRLIWPICFIRQFSLTASKADYLTLRNGFILANVVEGSNFNFHNFIVRAFDDDFAQVIGFRLWIWVLCVVDIFCSAEDIYDYYWLQFIPLVLVLAIGTKLETIITRMCMENCKHSSMIKGAFLITPNDEYFWFNRPKLLIYLFQFILIQNSFQLAFFTWAWYQYGLKSCFKQETTEIVIRITTGISVLFLCGYVTLPIYAVVSQMGCNQKKAVLTERVTKGLKNWHWNATHNLSRTVADNNTTLLPLMGPSNPEIKENDDAENDHDPSASDDRPSTWTSEFTVLDQNDDDHDDEISFASSWRKMCNSKANCSIIEEDEEDYFRNELINS